MTVQPEPDRCRSCKAPIVWATSLATGKAKRIPLDPDPDPKRGNIVLTEDLLAQGPVAHYLDNAAAASASVNGETLYLSHFVTCPDADEWRGGRAS